MTNDTNTGTRKTPARIQKDPELRKIYQRIGRRIKQLRLRAGISQREACDQVFGNPKKQGLWSRWEQGLELPNVGTLYRIAQWAGTNLGDLGLFEPTPTLTRPDLDLLKRNVAEMQRIVDQQAVAGNGMPARAKKR